MATLELSEEGTGLTRADLGFLRQGNSGNGAYGEEGGLQGAASGLLPKIKPILKSWRKAAGKGRRKRRWQRREGTKQPLHTNSPAGDVSNTPGWFRGSEIKSK